MRCGAAAIVAAIALALPAFGQHGGGGHGGSVGHSGSGGHAGFSGSRGFSGGRVAGARPGGYARPAMPMRSGIRTPYRGYGQFRPAYRPGYGGYRGNDRRRRGRYGGVYGYPAWGYGYPYPYVIDPGFYDWSDTGGYGDDQGGGTSQYAPYADYDMPNQEPYSAQPYGQSPAPYAQSPYGNPYAPSGARPGYGAPTASESNEQPLTLIFKDGRKPQTVQNYMMNTSTLTDLDPSHFERIPLEEIDISATISANRARGVDFAVPDGTR